MKTFKKLFSLCFALVLAFGALTTAVKADSIQQYGEDEVPQVGLTKKVTTKAGTKDLPSLTYEFEITQVKTGTVQDGAVGSTKTYDVSTNDLKLVGGQVLVKPNVTQKNSLMSDTNTDVYALESSSFFGTDTLEKLTLNELNNQDGYAIYKYSIKEKQTLQASELAAWGADQTSEGVYEIKATNAQEYNEKLTLSKAEYEMYVYAKKKVNANDWYIAAITVKQIKYTDGTPASPGDGKVPGTLGGDPAVDGDMSSIEFINQYEKTKGDDPAATDKGFELTKTVTGVNEDAVFLTGANRPKFDFDVTIELPADSSDTFAYAIEEASTASSNVFWTKVSDGSVTFNGKTATIQVSLAHNQRLVFEQGTLPAGTKVTVVEADYWTGRVAYDETKADRATTTRFKPSVNGKTLPTDEAMETAAGRDNARTGTTTLSADGSTNKIAYENNAGSGITPTGILMNYMPFFVIILLAIVGLVGSAVIKGSRKNALN